MNNSSVLSTVPVGQPVQLEKIVAGRRLKHRLTELGLTPGVILTVIQNNGGPILISVRDSRIAIGREMAKKIRVTTLDERIFIRNQSTNTLVSLNTK